MTPMSFSEMVHCYRASRALQRYLDGEADGPTATRIGEHLESCRRCGVAAATYRAISRALAGGTRDLDELPLRRLHAFTRTLTEPTGTGAPD